MFGFQNLFYKLTLSKCYIWLEICIICLYIVKFHNLKNISTFLILSCILFKSLEPAIVYIDFLRASKIKSIDNIVLKLTANHHTDLDVSPINKKKDINCTLSGLRINKDLINEFNDKIKDLIDHQDNKSKRSLVLSLDQFSNFIMPEKNRLAFLFSE